MVLGSGPPADDGAGSLGLYVHVPFCAAICDYCNFNRGLLDEDLKARYVEALVDEVRRTPDPTAADSIYFGGGTPSLLTPDEMSRIIGTLADVFRLDAATEVTLEANPESVTAAGLRDVRSAGVNRLSMGVQSFDDGELTRLGRVHTAAGARAAYAAARAAGFDNINLDLMMWLPGQSTTAWRRTVSDLIGLGPDHASLYMLELYPNAPLRESMARGGWASAPDEDAAQMYLDAMAALEQAGYEQYEISSVARPGRRCRHNLKYWADGEWIGFGCGAHSTRDGVRWKNESATGLYIDRVAAGGSVAVDRRRLADRERLGDALFMGLRLTDGLDLPAVERRYGVRVDQRFGRDLEPFFDAGLVATDGRRLRLTREGMLLANEVMAIFV